MRAITLIWIVFLTACTPRAVREAESVVAQADSLRAEGRVYGIDEGDSTTLAQAYETLKKYSEVSRQFSEICPFIPCTSSLYTYAHACYHYGRLLREKDNPVEAMQVFINATHSRTHDYHILGRVYSNMGEMAHLASDFQLSYDMFERSGDMFLQSGDTMAYYYALNDMAFELAEQRRERETLSQLDEIEKYCADSNVKNKVLETKSILYLKCKQYDSALYYASELCSKSNHFPIAMLTKAQIYSYQGVKDSAVYYAEQVLHCSSNLSDIHNALYILTNDDERKDKNAIRQTAAERSDVQLIIRTRKSKLAQATKLLEQDLTRKPDLRWVYAIIITLFVVGVSIFIYVYRKHKKQELLAQKLNILRQATTTMQERHDELETNYLNNHQHIVEEINKKCLVLRNSDKIHTTLAWKNYHKMCSAVDKQFYLLASKLQSKNCLNETEIRLSVLTLLDCGYDQMAELLYRSSTSIGTQKTRVAKKLGTSSKNLRQYLIDNECLK